MAVVDDKKDEGEKLPDSPPGETVDAPSSAVVSASTEGDPADGELEQPPCFNITVVDPRKKQSVIQVCSTDTVQDVRLFLADNLITTFYTCFTLHLDGRQLLDHAELGPVHENSVLEMIKTQVIRSRIADCLVYSCTLQVCLAPTSAIAAVGAQVVGLGLGLGLVADCCCPGSMTSALPGYTSAASGTSSVCHTSRCTPTPPRPPRRPRTWLRGRRMR